MTICKTAILYCECLKWLLCWDAPDISYQVQCCSPQASALFQCPQRYRKPRFAMCSCLPIRKLTSGQWLQRQVCTVLRWYVCKLHLGPFWQHSKRSGTHSPRMSWAERASLALTCYEESNLCKEKHLSFSGAALQSKWQALLSSDDNAD